MLLYFFYMSNSTTYASEYFLKDLQELSDILISFRRARIRRTRA